MAYSNFTLPQVAKTFGLQIHEVLNPYDATPPIAPSPDLERTLNENIPLALAINTEKARSEFLIAPILLELRRRSPIPISLFSGTEFTIDPTQGLTGYCDYLISLSPQQLMISAPIVAIVEAKNEDLKAGLGQCIAELVAAQTFNYQENQPFQRLYGIVTSGELWKFLQLEDKVVSIDLSNYEIHQIGKILAILLSFLPQAPTLAQTPGDGKIGDGKIGPEVPSTSSHV
jgi:hypothetical protein